MKNDRPETYDSNELVRQNNSFKMEKIVAQDLNLLLVSPR